MQTQRWSVGAGGVVAVLVAVIAVVHRHELLAPAPLGLRRGLLVVPVAGIVWFVALGRGRPVARAGWWRLLQAGFVALVLGRLVRDLQIVPDETVRAATVVSLAAVGSALLAVGVLVLEHRRGRLDLVERLLDAGMVAVALATACWVLVLRSGIAAVGANRLSAGEALVAVGLLVVASALVGGATSGYLDARVAGWGALAATCQLASSLVLLGHDDPLRPPILALLWWTLGVGFSVTALALLAAGTGDLESGPAPRWRPTGAAVACSAVLVMYVAEALRAEPGTGVRDARVLGGALVLLCGACLVRVARAVDRAERMSVRLASVARSDHLTGLTNRRTADEELRRLVARGPMTGDALAVVMIDLDNFKSFNDRFGHHAGDELLIEAGSAWAACLGSGQLLARYGGEEFLLVATGLAPSALTDLVDRMRRSTPRGQTFSAGLAAWDGAEGADSLVGRADHALYEAKASGRGRTCIAYITTSDPGSGPARHAGVGR